MLFPVAVRARVAAQRVAFVLRPSRAFNRPREGGEGFLSFVGLTQLGSPANDENPSPPGAVRVVGLLARLRCGRTYGVGDVMYEVHQERREHVLHGPAVEAGVDDAPGDGRCDGGGDELAVDGRQAPEPFGAAVLHLTVCGGVDNLSANKKRQPGSTCCRLPVKVRRDHGSSTKPSREALAMFEHCIRRSAGSQAHVVPIVGAVVGLNRRKSVLYCLLCSVGHRFFPGKTAFSQKCP